MTSPSSSLSPIRTPSRPTSRASARAPSPGFDDPGIVIHLTVLIARAHASFTPVAIRNHMSSLRHEIRQKQAQFNALETILLRGPRPLPHASWSPTASEFPLPPAIIPGPKMQRRTSWEALSAYTANGPDSHIPLPVNGRSKQDDIREGVPLEFGVSNASMSNKRAESPTRSMSRMSRVISLLLQCSYREHGRDTRELCWYVISYFVVTYSRPFHRPRTCTCRRWSSRGIASISSRHIGCEHGAERALDTTSRTRFARGESQVFRWRKHD